MREFDSGATRDDETGKPDYEGFLSPLVIEAYGEYMQRHRVQADGSTRDSDNWQRGFGLPVLMSSAWRHFFSWWKAHRGYPTKEPIEDSICALIFNASGYLHELLLKKGR